MKLVHQFEKNKKFYAACLQHNDTDGHEDFFSLMITQLVKEGDTLHLVAENLDTLESALRAALRAIEECRAGV